MSDSDITYNSLSTNSVMNTLDSTELSILDSHDIQIGTRDAYSTVYEYETIECQAIDPNAAIANTSSFRGDIKDVIHTITNSTIFPDTFFAVTISLKLYKVTQNATQYVTDISEYTNFSQYNLSSYISETEDSVVWVTLLTCVLKISGGKVTVIRAENYPIRAPVMKWKETYFILTCCDDFKLGYTKIRHNQLVEITDNRLANATIVRIQKMYKWKEILISVDYKYITDPIWRITFHTHIKGPNFKPIKYFDFPDAPIHFVMESDRLVIHNEHHIIVLNEDLACMYSIHMPKSIVGVKMYNGCLYVVTNETTNSRSSKILNRLSHTSSHTINTMRVALPGNSFTALVSSGTMLVASTLNPCLLYAHWSRENHIRQSSTSKKSVKEIVLLRRLSQSLLSTLPNDLLTQIFQYICSP